MKIDESILLSRDFDIFFAQEVRGRIRLVHCATFGAILPEELNDDDYIAECINRAESSFLFLSSEDIEIEEENVNHILGANLPEGLLNNEERRHAYIRTFVNMARKGYWSYDRYHSPHTEPSRDDNRFLLIAHPKDHKRLPHSPFFHLNTSNNLTLLDDYKAITN